LATTVANPGSIVVPLSEIIDQLQGKLSSSDIDALLFAIISKQKQQVLPGDLITADLMNQVLADLQDLNVQVAKLAGGTGSTTKNAHAVATFHDAWSAYGALVKNGEFLPSGTTVDAIRSLAEITAYLQDVMYAALAGGSLGYGGDSAALVEAMQRLYDKQHELVVLFTAPIPGITDSSDHQRFATLLNAILEQDNSLGEISLKKAVDTADLTAALAAQDRIDGMVRSEGGDVTTGNLEVTYLGAVGATETLVIGSSQPVLYRFNVANKTNRSLDVQLTAEFLPPRQAWTQLSVLGLDGVARSHIQLSPFNPTNPTNPAATQEIRVAAMTPTGATDGDTGVLQLSAFVPPPINRGGFATRQLTVRNAAVAQTPGMVTYSANSPIISGNLADATEMTPLGLDFTFNFSKGTGPTTRQFRFRLDIQAPSNPDPLFLIEFTPADVAVDNAASTAVIKTSKSFTMTDGDIRTVSVVVTPGPGSKNNDLTFTATVESATDGVKAQSSSFTISVKHP